MFHFLVGITLLKSVRPYFRKHILDTLETHDFLFLNTLLISITVFLYFIFKCCTDKSMKKTFENYKNMTILQFVCILLLAVMTVFSTILLLEIDKNYSTPLINSMVMKFLSSIMLVIISIFFFKESYSYTQLMGILFTIIGIIMLTDTSAKKNK